VSTPHVILDAGFGRGERFLALWEEWRQAPRRAPLHYLALTPQLPSPPDAAPEQLRALWPLAVPGWHRVLLDEGRVTLDLIVAPLEDALAQIEARVDAFYLPADATAFKGLARALAKLAAQDAQLIAPAPDEALVWALHAAGFVGASMPAAASDAAATADTTAPDLHARYSSRKPQPPAPPEPVRRAIVIGAGVAGAAACQRLCASGWEVTLIERHAEPGQEASGNRAGIFMPLLSKDDNIPTRLSRAAYLFALREWQRLGGVGRAFDGAACGVLQLARDASHAQVQREVVEAWRYPTEYVRWLDADGAGSLMGAATPHGGWLFEQGGWARPASLCQAMLDACGARLTRRFSSEALTLTRVAGPAGRPELAQAMQAAESRRVADPARAAAPAQPAQPADSADSADDGEWQVHAAGGTLLAQAPTVIIANGTGARTLAQSADLPLQALRGQVTHLALDAEPEDAAAAGVPNLSLVVCREAYVTPPSDGIVSAGATYDNDDDPELRAASQQENLARLADIMGGSNASAEAMAARLARAPLAGRVGFRCAAPDRLPLAGALPHYAAAGRLERLRDVPRHPGLYGLLGYASRGLIWAPLMAELLVSQLEHRPPPLEASLAAALDPGRFLLKQRRRAQ
jgi:tRNA 5-methylaminomethyl-2-thiouridine biosynthesis bifunctional protein